MNGTTGVEQRLSSNRTRGKLFFFQAEDGIRDRNVTGVQTCALPIWKPQVFEHRNANAMEIAPKRIGELATALVNGNRSEERRVGKECRAGGGSVPCKETAAVDGRGSSRQMRSPARRVRAFHDPCRDP